MYEIRSNVPLPDLPRRGRTFKYPVKSMKVGDSFFVPIEKGLDPAKARRMIRHSVYNYKARGVVGDVQFATRVMGDHIGVWRVK